MSYAFDPELAAALPPLAGPSAARDKYRLAPERPETSLAEDVLTGLRWLAAYAVEFGVDISRIALVGDGGGGCPAAGAAMLAVGIFLRLIQRFLRETVASESDQRFQYTPSEPS
jgi:carboxylesterase type B